MKCEASFYSKFKPIRNKLKTFRKDQIILVCFENLALTWNLKPIEFIEKNLPLPWNTMLILKWGIVYGANKIDGKPFSQNNFSSIYNMIRELPANMNWQKNEDPLSIWKLMRSIFWGQFAYQTNSGLYGLAISEIILKDIGIDYQLDDVLNKILGVNVEEFINFQTLITAMFVSRESYPKYTIEYFKTFTDKNNVKKIDRFLKYFSLNFDELESFMIDHHNSIANPEFECNLLSPLTKKPLYRHPPNYVAYNKTVINNFCEYGLYDLLKSNGSENFSGAFGIGFETYLTNSLDSLSINYFREDGIRKTFNVGSSVDFLLQDIDNVLLVEAKSSEMSELTPQNPEKKYLEQTFQNSLIKGYKQIFFTASELKKQNPNKFSKSNFWALIVTYKDFMFGAPESIWLEFMEEKMKDLLPKEIFNIMPIDPLKIFVVSVYEFDMLCLLTKQQNSNLFSNLTIPYENNKELNSKKFSFLLHYPLEELKESNPIHIKSKLEEIINRVKGFID